MAGLKSQSQTLQKWSNNTNQNSNNWLFSSTISKVENTSIKSYLFPLIMLWKAYWTINWLKVTQILGNRETYFSISNIRHHIFTTSLIWSRSTNWFHMGGSSFCKQVTQLNNSIAQVSILQDNCTSLCLIMSALEGKIWQRCLLQCKQILRKGGKINYFLLIGP
jgi:hypothetical protein